jgi:hypothetical protein
MTGGRPCRPTCMLALALFIRACISLAHVYLEASTVSLEGHHSLYNHVKVLGDFTTAASTHMKIPNLNRGCYNIMSVT